MWFRLGLVAFSIIGEVIEVEWKRDSYNVHDGGSACFGKVFVRGVEKFLEV